MSILASRGNSLRAYRAYRAQFLIQSLGGGLMVLGGCLLPKLVFGPFARLILVCCFFCGLTMMLWALGEPFCQFLHARADLAYENVGTEIRTIAHEYIDLQDRGLRSLVYLALVAVGLTFLRVLAAWPLGAPLAPFADWFRYGAWIAVLLLPVVAAFNLSRFRQALILAQTCRRQLHLSGFRPVSEEEVAKRDELLLGPPVVVTGAYRFQAGGIGWSWSDFQKSSVVFGKSGSGKTVTVLNALLDGLLSSANGQNSTEKAAALVLDPKGDYLEKIQRVCARLGRAEDLFVIDPNDLARSVRYNPFDCDDDALEISARFASVLQMLGMKNTSDTFWIDTAKFFIQHAIALLRATEPPNSPPSFISISELAVRPAALEARLFVLYAQALLDASGEIQNSDNIIELARSDAVLKGLLQKTSLASQAPAAWGRFFQRWLTKQVSEAKAIFAELKNFVQGIDNAGGDRLLQGSEAAVAGEYFSSTWLEMPEKTRGSVQTQLANMVGFFLTEPYRTLFSGRSTINLGRVLDEGKIFYVYMPSEDRSEMSRIINTLVKMEYYRQVLLKRRKSRPSLFLCDEFQSFFSADVGKGDGQFFEKSRESFHANIVATQNLGALLRDLPRDDAVYSFLGNCAVKIFLRNDEGKTNEFASKNVFGEYMGQVVNLGHSVTGRVGSNETNEGASIGTSLQRLPRVPPERLTQLEIPDTDAGIDYAEAMVHIGSRATVEIHRLKFKVHPLEN